VYFSWTELDMKWMFRVTRSLSTGGQNWNDPGHPARGAKKDLGWDFSQPGGQES
jgi:hypothetical protein